MDYLRCKPSDVCRFAVSNQLLRVG
uniref:Uncharacterized protein n=1 Tax=Arundo donax TaxID=35708 RepID=A0A0A9HN63_ARUDO